MSRKFNFRHVLMRVGIPSNNHNNWELGKMLSDIARKHGHPCDRILTEKTDPNPTVDAPHCIAHYPMEMFDEACEKARQGWDGRSRQITMDL